MDLERAVGRILRLTLILTVGGAAVYLVIAGWRGGCGFLLGGLVSWLNFHWLKKTVYALGEAAAGKPPRARLAVLLGLSLPAAGTGRVCYIEVFRNQSDGCFGGSVCAHGRRDSGNPDRTIICPNMNLG